MLRSARFLPLFKSAQSSSSVVSSRQLSFELSEQQQQFREAALKFSKEVIAPRAAEYDKSMEFPWDLVKQAHANGFMNPSIPTAYGNFN
jgi:acyl-CoA dehydrogenase